MFSHQRSIFLVSERELVGSKDEGRKRVTDPLVPTSTKVFPRCIQNLNAKQILSMNVDKVIKLNNYILLNVR